MIWMRSRLVLICKSFHVAQSVNNFKSGCGPVRAVIAVLAKHVKM